MVPELEKQAPGKGPITDFTELDQHESVNNAAVTRDRTEEPFTNNNSGAGKR